MAALFLNLLIIGPNAAAGSLSNAVPLITARANQTATLLSNGKLLVAGGKTNGGFTSPAVELYDPASGTWSAVVSMNADRAQHTATMLTNGQILVTGGYSSTSGALSSAELYDPIAGTWTTTGSMSAARFLHTATLLQSGQVLVVGGTGDGSTALSGAELYDPATGAWTAVNSLGFARFSHTATLLPSGQVLIAGGTDGGRLISIAELFDPSSETWKPMKSQLTARYSHTATLLPNGEVLLAGGTTNGSTSLSEAALFNPATETWTATNALNTARFGHTATLLPNGLVLVTGGTPDGSISLTNAETFNFNTGVWTATNSLNTARYSHTATLLASGEVLVAGGFNTNQALASVELFDPSAGAWKATGPMIVPQEYVTQTLLPNGKVLVLGGGDNRAQLYDPGFGTWATSTMNAARFAPSVTLLPNRKVLVASGTLLGGTFLSTAELYDPVTGTWALTGSLHQAREYPTATLLSNGNVLVAGGLGSSTVTTATAELYNPASGTWTVTGSLNIPRAAAITTLLPNGQVLVAGGFSGTTNLTSAELYDPGSGAWTLTGQLNAGRQSATATLLPNGKVLVVAGYGDTGALSSAELYDPTTGTWSLTPPLPGPRYDHSATLLLNGRTLIAGGSDGRNILSSALLYDIPTGSWEATASSTVAHAAHAASLLSNGKVLIAGGVGGANGIANAELYDPGLGFNASWQPQITSVSMLKLGDPVAVSGSGFRGISEGSSGDTPDSPADYPILELMNVNSGQVFFPLATNWSTNSITSLPVNSLAPGYMLATIFVNGIPGVGQIFKIPVPPSIVNLPPTAVGTNGATLNGQVLDTGGIVPAVTLYYGTSDGGTNAGAWTQSIALGAQSGAFAQAVTNLATNTTYFFTAEAVNSAGTTWATPSQSFTTVTPPVVTNLPASGLQGTYATLNGQVLSTGHQTPSVTVYYGTTDGGTNASAWEQSVGLGLQGGAFAQSVTGLSTNTTYFYTAEAVNVAGTNWAAPSQFFTTSASNALPPATAAVLTQHNDNSRTGMNLNETFLNTNNVNPSSFGLVYTRPVDDQIYAQPLVMTNVNIPGKGARNIVIIATVNDTVYAFDADDASLTAPYWTNSFIHPPNIVSPNNADESAVGACGGNYTDFSGKFGIVGTPVIDGVSGTIYLVARTKETSGATTSFVQRLHALDITTGLDRSNSPVVIAATYPGTGAGSSGGVLRFDPLENNQRPALALVNGIVYVCWSSHCDNGPYHGWVIGYNAATMQQMGVFNDTPKGSQGGIWMSGQGPSADEAGNIYLATGNGSVDTNDYGESCLKLSPTNSGTMLGVTSFFTPLDWSTLNGGDLDLGTAGVLLIPGTTLAAFGGKSGTLYVVDRDNMGGIGDSTLSWSVGGGEIHGGPVWWSGPENSFMYVWPDSGDHLRQYQFNGSFNIDAPFAQSATACGSGSPGGILSISANANNSGSAILWAVVNKTSDGNQSVVSGTLHAYNAENVASELWNSDMVPRDLLGSLAKFVPPTVANGKVYMATFSGRLNVYGLLPRAASMLSLSKGPDGITLSFAGVPGQNYTVVRAPTLAGPWNALATVTVNSSGNGACLDANPPADEAFYRVSYP